MNMLKSFILNCTIFVVSFFVSAMLSPIVLVSLGVTIY